MSEPKMIHYICPNPGCPTSRVSSKRRHEMEGRFLKLTEVELDSGGKEVSTQVIYQCVVCGHRVTF